MDNTQFKIFSGLRTLSIILVVIGIGTAVFGFINNPVRAWGNFLICNYYFVSLVIGASFFAAIQSITQSGWSAMFKRIPEAISGYLPFAAVLMLIMIFAGSHSLYRWTHQDIVNTDILMQHKVSYLNFTFFSVRTLIFMGVWIFFTFMLRKFSINEDKEGGLVNFNKTEFYSKVYIFVLALTFSLASFDWIMSIDSHWFSTIFAIKNFVSAFLHGAAAITLIVMLLNKRGYFPLLNSSHRRDFSRYIFMLSIMWGYVWFSEYFLIWYGNIPEETLYFKSRVSPEWNLTFFAVLAINWVFPFLFLMLNKIAKNMIALIVTSAVLLVGLWLDIYMQVMPGITGKNSIGIIELGIFSGFLGIFIFAVSRTLTNANLIPQNHPYLNESLLHKLH